MANKKTESAIGPLVVVFAGPNGSGKTSLIDELKLTGLATMRGVVPLPAYFINPDQVAKDLEGEFVDQDARDEAAQRAARNLFGQGVNHDAPLCRPVRQCKQTSGHP